MPKKYPGLHRSAKKARVPKKSTLAVTHRVRMADARLKEIIATSDDDAFVHAQANFPGWVAIRNVKTKRVIKRKEPVAIKSPPPEKRVFSDVNPEADYIKAHLDSLETKHPTLVGVDAAKPGSDKTVVWTIQMPSGRVNYEFASAMKQHERLVRRSGKSEAERQQELRNAAIKSLLRGELNNLTNTWGDHPRVGALPTEEQVQNRMQHIAWQRMLGRAKWHAARKVSVKGEPPRTAAKSPALGAPYTKPTREQIVRKALDRIAASTAAELDKAFFDIVLTGHAYVEFDMAGNAKRLDPMRVVVASPPEPKKPMTATDVYRAALSSAAGQDAAVHEMRLRRRAMAELRDEHDRSLHWMAVFAPTEAEVRRRMSHIHYQDRQRGVYLDRQQNSTTGGVGPLTDALAAVHKAEGFKPDAYADKVQVKTTHYGNSVKVRDDELDSAKWTGRHIDEVYKLGVQRGKDGADNSAGYFFAGVITGIVAAVFILSVVFR